MKLTLNQDTKILVINFQGKRAKMNEILDPISNSYEGKLTNRKGHNFPSSFIPNKHLILGKYKSQCLYVIGIYSMNDLQHELLHAKYYLDKQYKDKIIKEWESMEEKRRTHITAFLKRLGYHDDVIIDEYQAYKYSKNPNFFG
jgi:hypothetical protein